jgi:U3 small nucleolar RNA-associated protein 22
MWFTKDTMSSPKIQQFGRAVELVKVWLYRRSALITDTNLIGFSGYQIRAVLCHICASQSLPNEVSAYQLFKLFLSLLAKVDWATKSLVFGTGATHTKTGHLPYPVLNVPQFEGYNPLWRIPLTMMNELAGEANISLGVLDNMTVTDPYESLFSPLSIQNDFKVTIDSNTNIRALVDQISLDILTGLGKRLHKQILRTRATRTDTVQISISGDIDASTATILIDKGPSADSEDAKKFRSFWGSKSELRRFRDGSILECTVWSKDSPVAEQILEYLINAKYSGHQSIVSFCPLGACVAINPSHVELWSTFENLRGMLSNVKGLPISIVDLRPAHGRFTDSDLVSSTVLDPLDCVIEFESSQAWPNSRIAIWHSKCAFLLAIREGLIDQYCTVEIGAEEVSEEPFIDVQMKGSKLAFRVRVFAQIELATLENQLTSMDNPPALSDIVRVGRLFFEPMLCRRIHALSAECPAISGAIRAAKEWLDNHLLVEPWLDTFVACTMAHVVLTFGSGRQSPHVLFLDWLFFIANHAYKTNPIFMKWGVQTGDEDLESKYNDAVDERKSWWISSDIDPNCLFIRRPNEFESNRLECLAKEALALASRAEWDLIKFGTDNSTVFDVLMEVSDSVTHMDQMVKLLTDQFRKYFSFHYSKRHRLVGIVFDPIVFRPQSNAMVKSSTMLAVVDETAVPDITGLVMKMGALLGDSVVSIKIRQ